MSFINTVLYMKKSPSYLCCKKEVKLYNKSVIAVLE